jgi:hypothetical protein
MNISAQLQKQREDSRLSSLKSSLVGGIYEQKKKEQQRKKREKKLETLLKNALFLEKDEERKKRWIMSIPYLTADLLDNLVDAVIRENLRYKKGERDVVVELNKK